MALLTRNNNLVPLIQENKTLALPPEASSWTISQIVEGTGDMVMVTDRQGQIVYANRAFEQVTGYNLAEVLGQTPRLLKSGVHEQGFYRRLWGSLQQGETFMSELTNRKKNGELYQTLVTILPLHDEQGEISHFVAASKIPSEQDQERERFRQVEESLLQAFDHMQAGCLLIDFNWVYRYINEAAARQAHASRADFLGRKVMEVQPGIEQSPLFAHYLECQVQRIPQHFIVEYPFGYDDPSWLDFRVEPAALGILVLTG
jgi:PAS domain S-box-containing protein